LSDTDKKDPSAEDESLGTLFARLADDGTNLFRAELNLYRQAAFRRFAQARLPVIMIVAAILIAQSSVTTILVGGALGLAHWLGPAGGGLAMGVIGFAISGLLVKLAISRLTKALSEANDKEAIALQERVVEEKVLQAKQEAER
jgi:divalent metal cation (Fe/Co/Zn/Cd) transporter